jgi:phospholipid/cholesterol/gamma-HCH transport system ATP-binding protein
MADDPVIVVENVSKSFGNREVLKGVSFSVERGETVVILGRSGTGKSVTLKLIIGLMTPSTGRASVFGHEIHTLTKKEQLTLRRRLGYVFQGGALFDSLSILENVGFPLYQSRVEDSEIERRVRERLSMVGLAHTIHQMPPDLSGGMQKRVSLARAIIDLPEVVLYDEPTSGLDPLTTDVINQIILRLRSALGVTSVVVTHDIKSAFTIADRIIMLDQGRIVAQGTPQQIESSELPWVQHFIAGRALEGEQIDSGAFAMANSRFSRQANLSGKRVAVRGENSGEQSAIPPADQRRASDSQSPPRQRIRRRLTPRLNRFKRRLTPCLNP